MELVSGTLYKIKNSGIVASDIKAIMSITGTPSISYGCYADDETFPTTLSELVSDFPADATLIAGDWTSIDINNYDYIGFSGTGTVRIRNIDLTEVIES